MFESSSLYLVSQDLGWQTQDTVIEFVKIGDSYDLFAFIDGKWVSPFYCLVAGKVLSIIDETARSEELEIAAQLLNIDTREPLSGVLPISIDDALRLPPTKYEPRLPESFWSLDLENLSFTDRAKAFAEYWYQEALGFDEPTTVAHTEHLKQILANLFGTGFKQFDLDFASALALVADAKVQSSKFVFSAADLAVIGFDHDFGWWVEDVEYNVRSARTKNLEDNAFEDVSVADRDSMNTKGWSDLAAQLVIQTAHLKSLKRRNPQAASSLIKNFESYITDLNVPILLHNFVISEINDHGF